MNTSRASLSLQNSKAKSRNSTKRTTKTAESPKNKIKLIRRKERIKVVNYKVLKLVNRKLLKFLKLLKLKNIFQCKTNPFKTQQKGKSSLQTQIETTRKAARLLVSSK